MGRTPNRTCSSHVASMNSMLFDVTIVAVLLAIGNLIFRKTARNFNPIMATAAKVTIAEVEEIVEPGQLDPDRVHLASVYVKRIVLSTGQPKRIEKRTLRKRA